MSSLFGHALIGAAIGENAKTNSKVEKLFLCLFFSVSSICLDLDYLPTWFLGIEMEPRLSHSIGGCFIVAAIGFILSRAAFPESLKSINPLLIFAAPLSHLLMDFFVGVHLNPVFWPFNESVYAFSHGVLPSAGRLHIDNYYFWRNLVIELGILIPIAIAISPTARKLIKRSRTSLLIIASAFLFFGYVGYSLNR